MFISLPHEMVYQLLQNYDKGQYKFIQVSSWLWSLQIQVSEHPHF